MLSTPTMTTDSLRDAETLRAYAKLIPNGANRVLSLLERESESRHQREAADTRHAVRARWMAYTLVLMFCGGGLCLDLEGHDWLAAVLLTETLVAIAAAFIVVEAQERLRAGK